MTDAETSEDDIPNGGKGQMPDTEAFKLDRIVTPLGAANTPSAPVAPVAEEGDDERVTVFSNLVTGDGDIVGLVAYSIFKQHENDWLMAFRRAKSREPNEAESAAYILGEGTSRRLATYRHLAEATLAGRGPQISATPASTSIVQRSYAAAARYAPSSSDRHMPAAPRNIVVYFLFAVVLIVAVLLAARYGLPGIPGPAKP